MLHGGSFVEKIVKHQPRLTTARVFFSVSGEPKEMPDGSCSWEAHEEHLDNYCLHQYFIYLFIFTVHPFMTLCTLDIYFYSVFGAI